jgi:hypothetical protein
MLPKNDHFLRPPLRFASEYEATGGQRIAVGGQLVPPLGGIDPGDIREDVLGVGTSLVSLAQRESPSTTSTAATIRRLDAMLRYAQMREKQNTNPKRQPYNLFSNSCVQFAKGVVETAGVGTPWMVDPRPNSCIGEFRDSFSDLDFDAKTRKLVIGN